MARKINFYPTLELYHYNLLNPKVNYSFFYYPNNGNDISQIEYKIANQKYITLSTKNNHWDPINYDLYMNVCLDYENGSILYGENGICPLDGEISICLEWYSQKSKKRGIIFPTKKNDFLKKNNDKNKINFICAFEKNVFLNDVEINILIFNSKKSNNVKQSENFLNNEEGVVLGTLDNKTLFMTGTGSLFPIYIKSLQNNKLWELQIECNEPENDKFSDCVKLILNADHKDYPLLDVTSKKYCDRLIFEIISNAVTVIICYLKENKMLEDLSRPCSDGSILSFIKYYKDNLELNIDNVASISDSLRNYLDKE